ncbi:MAG: glycosyltransferase family 9 protein [bacterium]|nr:glycosyltransferase family 9 protein [bacterium]
MRPIPLNSAKNIAVIRTDHIGDLIVSTPFLYNLRQAAPQANITAILPRYTEQVLTHTGLTDHVLAYDGQPDKDFTRSLRELRADIAICLAPRTIAYKLTRATGAPCRVGYYYSNRPLAAVMCRLFYLTHSIGFNIDRELRAGRPIPHEVEQLGRLAQAMKMPYSDKSLHLTLTNEEQQYAEKLCASWRQPLIVLQLHNNWLSSDWTVKDLAKLTHSIQQIFSSGDIAICYGPSENLLSKQLNKELEHDTCYHFIGDLNFRQWAALFSRAELVLTPDTGAIHLAAGLHKPVIAVYETRTAKLNTQQWAPWQVEHSCIVKDTADKTIAQIISRCRSFAQTVAMPDYSIEKQ